jgi:hypothetical protein
MDLIQFITTYWHIILGLLSIVVLFVKAEMVNKDHERRLHELENVVKDMNPIFLDIRERLISIETTLKLHIQNDERRN